LQATNIHGALCAIWKAVAATFSFSQTARQPDENRTNVYKLFRATRTTPETRIDPSKQIAFYISGIGTPAPGSQPSLSAKLHEGLDQALGGGLAD
jgi:hypothetical protein